MIRRFLGAVLVSALAVVFGLVLGVTVSFKAGILAFALGLLLAIILVVLAVRRGVSTGRQAFKVLADEGRRSPGSAQPSFDPRVTTTVDDVTSREDTPQRDPRFQGGPATGYDGPDDWHPRRF